MSYESETQLEGLIYSYKHNFEQLGEQAIKDGEVFIAKYGGAHFNFLTHFVRNYIQGNLYGLHHPFMGLSRDKNCTPELVEETAKQAQVKYNIGKKILDTYFQLVDDSPEFRATQLAVPPVNPPYSELGINGEDSDRYAKWITSIESKLKSSRDSQK